MNINIKSKLFLLFLLMNTAVYVLTDINKNNIINAALDNSLKMLQAHYNILLESQHKTAIGFYKSTLIIDRVMEIMKEANTASKEKKAELRDELHNLVKVKFRIEQEKGVLIYHFMLPNNESFYRAHKPKKFGDDLTGIRPDLERINKIKKPIRTFAQGRVAHAFRNMFPLFDENNSYIGAVEVSFSTDIFQWYLNTVSHIHSHFIVNKNIFSDRSWEKDDLLLIYTQSAESKDYMFNLGDVYKKEVCVDQNKIKLAPIQEEIDYKITLGNEFNSYVRNGNHFEIISFLPIKNVNNKVVAWVVSYQNNDIIKSTIESTLIIRVISFFISLLIIYFLVRQIKSKEELKIQHYLLNDILNETDNAMLVTDFKVIKYSNHKFKELIEMTDTEAYDSEQPLNILNMFAPADGYLHSGLLVDDENFTSLIARTPEKDRLVSILDRNLEVTAFKISISKLETKRDYLVTLSDVTKMKEYQLQTEEKVYMDGLTNVYNRNKFDETLKNEIKNVQRYDHALSIAILDIDKFKDFNDTYGHLVGDEVLITMAQTVNASVRETDTFARWGGEEFVIIFKNTNSKIAKIVSDKLREKIQDNEHPMAGKITVSFGVTEYKDGDTIESILKRCDDALYIAKNNGRNRVEVL